jgi:hypothetical protein
LQEKYEIQKIHNFIKTIVYHKSLQIFNVVHFIIYNSL